MQTLIEVLPPIAHPRSAGLMASAPKLDRFLTLEDVKSITTLSKSVVYSLISAGKFPKPVPIAGRRVAWLASEIAIWQRERVLAA